MAFINEKLKEVNCKILYYGPALCGKSTSLRHIYQNIKEQDKGELVSLSTPQDRTLYFDFLPINLGKRNKFQVRLHLYTVPGEAAYKVARKIIAKGVDGVVFLADSRLERLEDNLASMVELKEMIDEEGGEFEKLPMVLQYNKRDLPGAVALDELKRLLNPRKVPDFETVATQGKGIFEALKSVSAQVLKTLKE